MNLTIVAKGIPCETLKLGLMVLKWGAAKRSNTWFAFDHLRKTFLILEVVQVSIILRACLPGRYIFNILQSDVVRWKAWLQFRVVYQLVHVKIVRHRCECYFGSCLSFVNDRSFDTISKKHSLLWQIDLLQLSLTTSCRVWKVDCVDCLQVDVCAIVVESYEIGGKD